MQFGLALAGTIAAGVITTLSIAQSQQPAAPAAAAAMSTTPFDVTITIDANAKMGPMKPIYNYFGADEPNYAYMPDGEKLIKDIGALNKRPAYFRAHSMMVTGDGTPALKWGSTNMYREDAEGRPIYDWTIADKIFDTYIKNGVRPYAQIGFMPEALSTTPQPYKHNWKPGDPYSDIYTGWSYPPKDYDKWRELVYQWVKHCVERYGKDEVATWYWEVWNESNAGNPRTGAYWRGTPEEFRKLHDYAIDGVRKALPNAIVGGPDTAGPGGQWMRDFLEHCLRGKNFANGGTGTPIDFIAFHAKGSPAYVDANGRGIPQDQAKTTPGHVRMGISNQLRAIDSGFGIVASYPELKSKPIIIGESDPDGCAACQATVYPQNGYRNNELYASYTAASYARKHLLADKHGVNLEGAITWAFEFEDQPIFAGFRVMSTDGGIDLPVFNVFRMMGKMDGDRLKIQSTGEIPLDEIVARGVRAEKPDVSAMATIDGNNMAILTWHYHDDEIPGPDAAITMALKNIPHNGTVQMTQYLIDANHTNPYNLWKKMGSPPEPNAQQMAQLDAEGNLKALGPATPVTVTGGAADIKLQLVRQGVSLTVLSW
jgi:xylan 1,4-beta-xylosidase